MKYITTDKHPELKEGIEILPIIEGEENIISEYVITIKFNIHGNMIPISLIAMGQLEEFGYIKELQEPEFTKDDVKIMSCEFAIYIVRYCTDRDETYPKLYDEWLKQRNR